MQHAEQSQRWPPEQSIHKQHKLSSICVLRNLWAPLTGGVSTQNIADWPAWELSWIPSLHHSFRERSPQCKCKFCAIHFGVLGNKGSQLLWRNGHRVEDMQIRRRDSDRAFRQFHEFLILLLNTCPRSIRNVLVLGLDMAHPMQVFCRAIPAGIPGLQLEPCGYGFQGGDAEENFKIILVEPYLGWKSSHVATSCQTHRREQHVGG
jgi:hypothetical protein